MKSTQSFDLQTFYLVCNIVLITRVNQDDDFSDGGPGLEPVQIKPQKIKMKLIPSKSTRTFI